MTAIYQSPFLLALGWTIASSLWQTALLWMLYQVIINANGKMSPAARHNLALAGIVCAFGWFGTTLSYKYHELQQLFSVTNNPSPIVATANATADTGGFMFTSLLNQYLPYISASYLLVLALLAVRLIKAYFYTQTLKTKGLLEIDEYWSHKVERYIGYLHIHKKVSIYISSYIDVPATLNYFKPVILLPVAAFTQLTPQQVESVILHELAHIKRNDYLINILVSVIETILFFNPFVHLLGKSLKKEREHCCDDFVLHFRFDPHSYASALLSLEKLRIHSTPVGALAATGNSRQLLGRIKRIMNVHNTGFNYGQKLLVLLVTACILISVAWLSPVSTQNSTGSEEKLPDRTIAATEEECIETNEEAVAGTIIEKRSLNHRSVEAPPESSVRIANVAPVLPPAVIKPLPGDEAAALNGHLPTPRSAPAFELYAPPAMDVETAKDPQYLHYEHELKEIPGDWFVEWEDMSAGKKLDEKKRILPEIIELFREHEAGLANRQLKLRQLEHLLNSDLFENVDLHFEGNGNFNFDFNIKKTEGTNRQEQSTEKTKKYKTDTHFTWSNEAGQQQLFYHKKQWQLDSLKQKSLLLMQQQQKLLLKKNEAIRQMQNAFQQTYFDLFAENDRPEQQANSRRKQIEKRRSAAVAVSAVAAHKNAKNALIAVTGTPHKAPSIDIPPQISRVVIDSGNSGRTIVISIE
ncbi:MAG: M56 family metallopeptidase [Chitinophagaceae bacterium]|nr:M56 family metallopeptidase [Chitinophagaceae bacterium]